MHSHSLSHRHFCQAAKQQDFDLQLQTDGVTASAGLRNLTAFRGNGGRTLNERRFRCKEKGGVVVVSGDVTPKETQERRWVMEAAEGGQQV